MSAESEYVSNFLRWKAGRQHTGYEKMLLLANPFILPFDCYLLRYRPGTAIPEHTDPVDEKKHFRLNLVIRKAKAGGEFFCSEPIYESTRIKYFRPDLARHSVSLVEAGTRYVLSIGWVRK